VLLALGTIVAEPATLLELRAIVALAALDLDVFLDQLPLAAVEELGHSGPLRLQTKTRAALARGANPQIGNPLALSHGLPPIYNNIQRTLDDIIGRAKTADR
jgi:hypothetical protein